MAPAIWEIRVAGRVGPRVLAAFDDFEASTNPAETILCGRVTDQAALHGLLTRIQSLGLELIEVRKLPQHGCAELDPEIRSEPDSDARHLETPRRSFG
jgi:hypothetical protein